MKPSAGGPPFVLFPFNQRFLNGTSDRIAWFNNAQLSHVLSAVGVVVGALFAVILAASLPGWLDRLRFDREAVPATGYVVSLSEERGRRRTYYVVYRIATGPEGGGPERKARVDKGLHDRLRPGDAVAVRCLPGDPATSRLDGEEGGTNLFTLLVFGGFAAPGVFGLRHLIRVRNRARRLARDGQALTGEVRDCTGRKQRKGGYIVELRFAFREPGGQDLEAAEEAERRDLLGQPLPLPGTPVVVLFVDEKCYQVL
jgi:hypothetical protein